MYYKDSTGANKEEYIHYYNGKYYLGNFTAINSEYPMTTYFDSFVYDFTNFYGITLYNPSEVRVDITNTVDGNTETYTVSRYTNKTYEDLQIVYEGSVRSMYLLEGKYYKDLDTEICGTTDDNETKMKKILEAYDLSYINPSTLYVYSGEKIIETLEYKKYTELTVKYTDEEGDKKTETIYEMGRAYYMYDDENEKYLMIMDSSVSKEIAFKSIISAFSLKVKDPSKMTICDEDENVLESYDYTLYKEMRINYVDTSKNICEEKLYYLEEYTTTDPKNPTDPIRTIYDKNYTELYKSTDANNIKFNALTSNYGSKLYNPSTIYIYDGNIVYESYEYKMFTSFALRYNKDNSNIKSIYELEDYYYDVDKNKIVSKHEDTETIFKTIITHFSLENDLDDYMTIGFYEFNDWENDTPILIYTYSRYIGVSLKYVDSDLKSHTIKIYTLNNKYYDVNYNVLCNTSDDNDTKISAFNLGSLYNPSKITLSNISSGVLIETLQYEVYVELTMKIENGGNETTNTIYLLNGYYYNSDKTKSCSISITDDEKINKFVNDFEITINNNSVITIKNGETTLEIINYISYYDIAVTYNDANDGNKEKKLMVYTYNKKAYIKTGGGYEYFCDFPYISYFKDEELINGLLNVCNIKLPDPSFIYSKHETNDLIQFEPAQYRYDTKEKRIFEYLKSSADDDEYTGIDVYYKEGNYYLRTAELEYTLAWDKDYEHQGAELLSAMNIKDYKDHCFVRIVSTDGEEIYEAYWYTEYTTYGIEYVNSDNKSCSDVLYYKDTKFYDKNYTILTQSTDDELFNSIINKYNLTLWDPSYVKITYCNIGNITVNSLYKKKKFGDLDEYSLTYTVGGDSSKSLSKCYYNKSTGKYCLNRQSNTSFKVICDQADIPSKLNEAYSLSISAPCGVNLDYIKLADDDDNVISKIHNGFDIYLDSKVNTRFEVKKNSNTYYGDGYYNSSHNKYFYYFIINGTKIRYNSSSEDYTINKKVTGYLNIGTLSDNSLMTYIYYLPPSSYGISVIGPYIVNYKDESDINQIKLSMNHWYYFDTSTSLMSYRFPGEFPVKNVATIIDYRIIMKMTVSYSEHYDTTNKTTLGDKKVKITIGSTAKYVNDTRVTNYLNYS